jgi:hypothetical protein
MRMRTWRAALGLVLAMSTSAFASDYASEISAYRRAHGLSAVRADGRLGAIALRQAQAMALSGTISHSAAGSFLARRTVAQIPRRGKYRGRIPEFHRDPEAMGRLRRASRQPVAARRKKGRRGFGGQCQIALPDVLGDGDH